MSDRVTTEYPPICIVSPSEFDPGTAQTSGSIRLAAIAPQLFIRSALWGGLFKVEPGARTGGVETTFTLPELIHGICNFSEAHAGDSNGV
jgi:hypothetical protein